MAYCTQADLLLRFGPDELRQLTDTTQAADINATTVSDACDEASSLIDSKLSDRYTTPLSIVPPVVRKWACDIARYMLRGENVQEHSAVLRNYRDAIDHMDKVARGVNGLPDLAGVDAATTDKGGIVVRGPAAVFTDELMAYIR